MKTNNILSIKNDNYENEVNLINKEMESERKITNLGGFDKKNTNYFVITGDLAALQFVGERHEIFFDAGLFSMNLE